MKRSGNLFGMVREDWWFLITTAVVWFLGLAVTFGDFFILQERPHSWGALNVSGGMLLIVGVAIRVVARRTLGRFFSPFLRIKRDHRLVTRGIYRKVRHPAYTGTILLSLGIALAFGSIMGFLIMLLLIPCILYRIPAEERMLTDKFGEEYISYKKRTKKLIPFLY